MNKRLTGITLLLSFAIVAIGLGLSFYYYSHNFQVYILTLTPTMTSIPTATPTLQPTVTTTKIPAMTFTPLPQVVSGDSALLQQELKDLQREIIALRQQVDTLSQNNESKIKDSDINKLQDGINTVSQRLETIENVILDSPAKALEITLLRQEIENLQLSYQQDLNSTRVEIDRIYDLSKWFLGLILTMALSLISLAVSNFLKINKPNDVQESSVKSSKKT